MSEKRFSKEELFQVGNLVLINEVIEHIMGLPCKVRDGHLRFICPLCSEFTTATNPRTNLARCFRLPRETSTPSIWSCSSGAPGSWRRSDA